MGATAEPLTGLRARLEARRQARLNASPEAVGLDQKLAQLRAMRNTGILAANRAVPDVLWQPQPAEATAAPAGAPPGAGQTPPVLSAVSPADARMNDAADRIAAQELAAGRTRARTPGAAIATGVELAAGRALAHLPGVAGEAGEQLASGAERIAASTAAGAETLPFYQKLPADVLNLMVELEAGGRIAGPIGRVIGAGYREPVMANLAGELAAPGLAATAGRVLRMGGREAARFGTLETVKGLGEQAPPEETIVRGLEGGASGLAWGAGVQGAREVLARAVAAALRSRLGAPGPYPRPIITTGREVSNEPVAPPAGLIPPGRPPIAPAPAITAPAPSSAPAPAATGGPVNVEAFTDEIAAGKYTDRELKTIRAKILAGAGPAMRAESHPVTRIVDAIDTHLQAKGVAGAAPIEPSPPIAPEAKPGEALHDAQGNVVPGSDVASMDPRAAAERRQAAGGPPAGVTERRAHVPFVPSEPWTSPAPVSPPATEIPPASVTPPTPPVRTVQSTLEEGGGKAAPLSLGQLHVAAAQAIKTGTLPKDTKGVRQWAETVLGEPYSAGKWNMDDVHDAIETAANEHALDTIGPIKGTSGTRILERLKLARELEEKTFGTRARTEGVMAQQQFSTPLPIAQAAAYATDVVPGEKVLEPTAGTGNLVAPLFREGLHIDANEIDDRRQRLLRVLGGGEQGVTITGDDALKLFLSGKRYNAIVMNPPFGGYNLGKYAGKGTTEFAASDVSQRFVAAALRSLAPGGRLVAVMPQGLRGPAASVFRRWLTEHYTVRAYIESPEGSYATRGTKVGTWMLVVDNTGAQGPDALTAIVERPTWEHWERAVARLGAGGDLARTGGHEPAPDVAAASATEAPAAATPIAPAALKAPTPLAPTPLTTPSSAVAEAAQQIATAVKDALKEVRGERPEPVKPSAGEPPRVVGGGAGEAPAGGMGGERSAGPGGSTPEPGRSAEPEPGRSAGVVAGEAPAHPPAVEPGPAQGVVPRLARKRIEPGRLDSPERRAELQAANDSPVFTPYERGTAVERNPHPRLVVETRSQAGMPAPVPHITKFQSPLVEKAWGRSGAKGGISDDQADMALRVLSAWERGHGFVVADDVGVGKTREAAVLILELLARGETRILYTTKNETNLADVQKELRLVATGSDEGEFPATFVIGQEYPKAATRSGRVRTEGLPQPKGATVYLVHSYNFEPLSESIMEVAPTAWIGDEAHEYKNGYSKRGMAWQRLHSQMLDQDGKFAYFTATPAVTLDELGYLYGLKEWRPGGFPDWIRRRLGKDPGEETGEGGAAVAAQQAADVEVGERPGTAPVVSTDLAPGAKRPFMREQLDAFSGRITPAETEQVMRELKGMGKFLARDLWRGGVEFNVHTLDLLTDTASAHAARERYDQAADLVRSITKAARKFGYLNQQIKTTGLERAMIQSYMKQLLFDLRLPEILRLADASLAAGKQVVISVHSVTGDVDAEEGMTEDVTTVPLNKRLESAIARINTREIKAEGEGDDREFVDLGEIPEALAVRAELLDKLRELPPLKDPVRALEDHFGSKKLAIITGNVTPPNRTKQMGEFQAGKRPVAIISKAGKIGISLHDVNGKARHLIVGDYEWSADTFKQELGRVDRTGQRSKPTITLVASNVGGERKFASTIAARMATLGATSKGAAEATGTDALDQFEATGDLPVAAMKNAVEKMDDRLRQYFTGSKFVEAKQTGRGERVFVAKRRPEDGDMRSFLLEMLMFPVKEANEALDLWVAEREKLMTGEAVAAAEARKTGKLTGTVLRVTDLTTAPQPTLTMYEVENDAKEHRAILQGFVTQHIETIQNARGTDEFGHQRARRYVSFTDKASGELIAGLEVATAEARRIKTAFGAGERRFLTPADVFSDLQAGDDVKIDGPEGADWVLHPRKDGRIAIRGATLSKHRDTLSGYALYEGVGNYLYVKGGDTPEGVGRFLERFPVKQAAGAVPAEPRAVPPEPTSARYERLGRILSAPLDLKARELIRDRLIAAGNDRAEVEALDDRGLTNRAMEQEVLTPEEETKLLDRLLGERGAVRLSMRGRARKAAPPDLAARSVRDGLKRLFNPAARTESAAEAAAIVRARAGEMARENEVTLTRLGDIRRGFPKLDTANGVEFADQMENGQPVDPALQPSATLIREILDAARERVQALGTGKLEHFIADYLPHLWEKPEQAIGIIARIMGKRPLQGPKTFLKHRTIPTIAEGIEAGLKPVTTDLLDMVALKLREMNRYVMGQRILQDLRRDGLVSFVKAGKAAPAGYRRIDDSIATVYGPFTGEGAMTIRGQYYAPEPVALILNNYLSSGLRGNVLFDGYMFVGNTLNAVQLGLSLFHLGFVSTDAIVSQMALGLEKLLAGRVPGAVADIASHWTAPLSTLVRGNQVIAEYTRPGTVGGDFAAIADAVTAGGGRVRMDRFYKNNAVESFLKAVRAGRVGTAAMHLLPAAMEFAAKPLMEYFVPRMKLGVFADLARFELSRLPADATPNQVQAVMAKAWDSVDNRMGQLVYDNLFWNKTIKDLGMASVRALGWNLGSARELGGGVYDLGRRRFTHRGAYVIALPIAVGLMGAVLMYLFTGHGPTTMQDYYEPRTGRRDADGNDERVNLPSYMKDVIAFSRHPLTTIGHKLHPLLSYIADMLGNEDYWGDQIRNPHDPLVTQLKQVADYTATQFQPIGFRNVQEQRRRLQTGGRAALPFVGITPASREAVRTPAQNLMHDFLQQGGPSGATPEEAAERQVRGDIQTRYRQGQLSYGQARDSLMAAGLSRDQTKDALRRMLENPIVTRFKQLTLEQARAVYAKGTAQEKDLWAPTLFRKEAGGHHRAGQPRPPHRAAPRRR